MRPSPIPLLRIRLACFLKLVGSSSIVNCSVLHPFQERLSLKYSKLRSYLRLPLFRLRFRISGHGLQNVYLKNFLQVYHPHILVAHLNLPLRLLMYTTLLFLLLLFVINPSIFLYFVLFWKIVFF